mmetsp:Transcript_23476/g.67042  ORF Transcript_23476/g.67042 Transcript_23476/m.67042 type:complete len:262 (+) Transcript_23476:221-1006(+)
MSAFRTVESRWATTMEVPPFRRSMSEFSASWTMRSDSASRAEVASSRSRIAGSTRSARAIATRCFWPPLSWMPRSPTSVSYLSGNSERKSWQLASFAAPTSCSSVASSTPKKMFSRAEAANRTGSCETTAICLRMKSLRKVRTSWPSIETLPEQTSYSRKSSEMQELLPLPDWPTSATTWLGFAEKVTSSSTLVSGRVMYEKLTLSNSTKPEHMVPGSTLPSVMRGSRSSSEKIFEVAPMEDPICGIMPPSIMIDIERLKV